MDISEVLRAASLMSEAQRILGGGPADYYLKEMAACYTLLMERFAPLHVGDRVVLTRTPVINEKDSWGWMSSKHFLKAGARGIVRDASCGQRGFRFGIEFDDESYIDVRGQVQPVREKHTYGFGENSLARICDEPISPDAAASVTGTDASSTTEAPPDEQSSVAAVGPVVEGPA